MAHPCPYTKKSHPCAGCHFQINHSWEQVSEQKWHMFLKQWKEKKLPPPEQNQLILPEALSIRSKADIKKIKHHLGFYNQNKEIVDIENCLLWTKPLQEFFSKLRPLLQSFPAERASFRLRYHKGQNYLWVDTAHVDTKNIIQKHQNYLNQLLTVTFVEWGQKRKVLSRIHDGSIRLKKTLSVLPPIFTSLNHQGESWSLHGHVADFTQSSESVNRQILTTLQKEMPRLKGRLIAYEFGCGIGNLSLALAPFFTEYHGFEWDPFHAQSFLFNRQKFQSQFPNSSINLHLHRKDAAYGLHQRQKNSYSQKTFLSEFKPAQTLILNPARSGVGQFLHTCLGAETQNIIYLSCYPETMMNDLSQLDTTWSCLSLYGFDPFLYSRHLEVLAVLQKK